MKEEVAPTRAASLFFYPFLFNQLLLFLSGAW